MMAFELSPLGDAFPLAAARSQSPQGRPSEGALRT